MEPSLLDTPLIQEKFVNDEIKNYLIAIQLVDIRIMEFIDGLKREGLYDNSIIVITGDHEQMTFNTYEGREKLRAEDCYIPFLIINSPLDSKHTDEVIGQVDIYPSLLTLMGCSDYSFRGLGDNVFGDNISNYATFRTGLEAGGTGVSETIKQHRKDCWKVSNILLRMDYFASH